MYDCWWFGSHGGSLDGRLYKWGSLECGRGLGKFTSPLEERLRAGLEDRNKHLVTLWQFPNRISFSDRTHIVSIDGQAPIRRECIPHHDVDGINVFGVFPNFSLCRICRRVCSQMLGPFFFCASGRQMCWGTPSRRRKLDGARRSGRCWFIVIMSMSVV